jgi:small subunit ribosomal protein S17
MIWKDHSKEMPDGFHAFMGGSNYQWLNYSPEKLVETYKNHPKYHKRVKNSKKYCVHDEKNIAKVGDTVRIVETRPLSKTKHFYLKEIVKEAVII